MSVCGAGYRRPPATTWTLLGRWGRGHDSSLLGTPHRSTSHEQTGDTRTSKGLSEHLLRFSEVQLYPRGGRPRHRTQTAPMGPPVLCSTKPSLQLPTARGSRTHQCFCEKWLALPPKGSPSGERQLPSETPEVVHGPRVHLGLRGITSGPTDLEARGRRRHVLSRAALRWESAQANQTTTAEPSLVCSRLPARRC